MHGVLAELNARVLSADRTAEETFDRAWRMLRMRRVLAESGGRDISCCRAGGRW